MARNYERTMKVGDTGPALRVCIKQTSDGQAPEWDLASVRFYMLQVPSYGSSGQLVTLIDAAAAIEAPAASSGTLVYNWASGDTDIEGRHMAFFTVTTATGDVETYPEEGYIWVTLEERGPTP